MILVHYISSWTLYILRASPRKIYIRIHNTLRQNEITLGTMIIISPYGCVIEHFRCMNNILGIPMYSTAQNALRKNIQKIRNGNGQKIRNCELWCESDTPGIVMEIQFLMGIIIRCFAVYIMVATYVRPWPPRSQPLLASWPRPQEKNRQINPPGLRPPWNRRWRNPGLSGPGHRATWARRIRRSATAGRARRTRSAGTRRWWSIRASRPAAPRHYFVALRPFLCSYGDRFNHWKQQLLTVNDYTAYNFGNNCNPIGNTRSSRGYENVETRWIEHRSGNTC